MRPRLDPVVTINPPRRRRRRQVSPFLVVLGVASFGFGIGWLWYSVFSPLFVDAKEHIAKERSFRRVLRRVVLGRADGLENIPDLPEWPDPISDARVRILACADSQVAYHIRYTKSYYNLDYPWGDIAKHLGTSPDLLVRCLRATGLDLQQLIYIDRVNHADRYPVRNKNHRKPDKSVEHRRIANLYTFLKTYAPPNLPVLMDSAKKLAGFQPGDIVFWAADGGGRFPGNIGIVMDRRGPDGTPRVVTVVPADRRISAHHRLDKWTVTGHFRVDPDALLDRFLQENPDARLAPRVGVE